MCKIAFKFFTVQLVLTALFFLLRRNFKKRIFLKLSIYLIRLFEDWKVKVKSLSRVWIFVTPWTVAHQAPPSMEFSRQEYWSGLPFPSPGDLPNTGMEPRSPALQADALPVWATREPYLKINWDNILKIFAPGPRIKEVFDKWKLSLLLLIIINYINELHVHGLSRFTCWNSNPQWDGIRRWELIRSWGLSPHLMMESVPW